MKIKDVLSPLFFIGLGIAFLCVSVWFFISKNPDAIRYKYKIGGMILSLSFFTSSCNLGNLVNPVTCYDPLPPDNSVYSFSTKEKFQQNDSLFFYINFATYPHYSFLLTDSVAKKDIKKDFMEYSEEKDFFFIPLKSMPEEYQGRFAVKIFGEENEELQQINLIHTETFTLNNDAAEN